jgi:hypothetical protein
MHTRRLSALAPTRSTPTRSPLTRFTLTGFTIAGLTISGLLLCPAASSAQVINRPQRAFRGLFGGGAPPDPNRARNELTFTANTLGGYDDNAAAGEGIGAPTDATPTGAGYTGTFDAGLNYYRGKATRSFTLDTRVGLSTYRNVPLDPSTSYSLNLSGQTALGRRTSINVGESLSYSSQYRLDSPLTGGIPVEDLPTTDSSLYGLGGRASLTSNTSLSLEQRLSRDDRLTGSYGYTTTNFTQGDTGGYRSHRASARYGRQVGRWSQANGVYEYSTTRFGFGPNDDGRPMSEHRISGGFSVERRLSPRRSLSVTVDGGALNLESVTGEDATPYSRWAPFVQLSTRLDLARSWNLSGNYRRGSDTLEGLTTEAFINDAGTGTLSGLLSRRLELAIIGGVARGTTAAQGGVNSKYLTTTASTQLRFAMSRILSAVVSYHYYQYNFDNTVLPEGVAPRFDRNAVRVGLAFWLPIYGVYDRP